MKVAILGESPADEAAFRFVIDTLLGIRTEPVEGPPLRSRGWPAIFNVLPAVLKHLHYRTDAEAFVVVVDSNHSPVCDPTHATRTTAPACRLCKVDSVISAELERLRPVSGKRRLKTAVGIAVPAIEAWLRCGQDPGVSEAAWIQGLQAKKEPYTKNQLKESVYGTSRPSLPLEAKRATEEARRISADLELLERKFPLGFGILAKSVRSWSE